MEELINHVLEDMARDSGRVVWEFLYLVDGEEGGTDCYNLDVSGRTIGIMHVE